MPAADSVLPFLLTAVAAYLIGSVDFSIITTRLFARTDVRQHGSGNAGTTNVLRTAGKLPAALTFVGDFCKCVIAVLVGRFLFHFFGTTAMAPAYITGTAGIFCILGHIFPLFFGFRGGKGVATTAGLALMVDWRGFIVGMSLFVILVLVTRIVSLSALIAVGSMPFVVYGFLGFRGPAAGLPDAAVMLVAAVFIFMKHHANIKRLLAHAEPHIALRHGRKCE